MMRSAKVSISRPSRGDDREGIKIAIKDKESGNRLIELDMALDDFTRCLTGLSECPADVTHAPTTKAVRRLGMQRYTRRVYCPKVSDTERRQAWPGTTDREIQREIVVNDYLERFEEDGWELMNTGIQSQQNETDHHYVIVRYVAPTEEGSDAE